MRLQAISTGDWIWPSKWKPTQSPQGVSPPSLLSGTFDKWTLKTTWASRQFLWKSLDEGGDAQVLIVLWMRRWGGASAWLLKLGSLRPTSKGRSCRGLKKQLWICSNETSRHLGRVIPASPILTFT